MKKRMKTVTCPCCNGIGFFTIRNYHGSPSSNPSVNRYNCHYCFGALTISVSDEWTKEHYLREVRDKIAGVHNAD